MRPYLYLVALWMLFGLLHSLLAADWWKQWVQRKMGGWFPYYRLFYSLLALLLLIVIVLYHWQIPYLLLWHTPLWLQVISLLLFAAGLAIMAVCTRKYFFYLSGIAVLFPQKESSTKLETGGMHRYVRHPLYFGTLLTLWALLPLLPLLSYLVTCVMVTLYTCIGVVMEERKLRKEFGREYVEYQNRVPMWGIRIKAASGELRASSSEQTRH
jgi:protein-S-isoprenylcysteine O-methyltransferase Ste14